MKNFELKIPPIALVVIVAVMMWFVGWVTEGFLLSDSVRMFLLGLFLLAGVSIGLAGVKSFRQAQTTVNPMTPEAASSLVSSGIFQRTRNPMYVGMALCLTGWGLFLANFYALGGVIGFIVYMTRFQIIPEERALTAHFGIDFESYRKQVPRWL
ncbi:methyltransferase family protein [Sansalvadorimonas verongulae]|uniref:methyltransferase family protein n=1 Tax=Sansalvadorimonas verongulae TaxID=2172824 RepID=UPI0012BCFB05|nr:isoprenylcysteine carboxylmethyltransferase family protein [Sansalvadorimonas verongulae]MTI12477.1 isoprenylcysteine carboxylmethyltransferase family protein [Sansalvadorimonas verongulae]